MAMVELCPGRTGVAWLPAAAACVIASYPLLVASGMGLSFVGSSVEASEWGFGARAATLLSGLVLLAATLIVPVLSVLVRGRRVDRPRLALAVLVVWQWVCIAGVVGALTAFA